MCLASGPFNLRASSTATSISLSWMQENPTTNLDRYMISATYVGPCTNLTDTDPITIRRRIMGGMGGMGGGRNQVSFSDLVSYGSYDLTVSVVSRNSLQATATINAWTMASGV